MAILSGWYFNEKFKTFSWEELRSRRTWQFIGLTLVLIFAIFVALGPIFLGQVQLGGQTQQDLQTLGQVLGGVIAAGVVFWLWQQLVEGVEARLRRFLWAVSIFILLSLLTIRFTYMSSFPNADYAKEFMVYAHGAPAAKSIVMDQIQTLSLRQHGDLSLKVAFGGSGVSWPFTWYMRDYANRLYFGENPSATLNEYDVVIVGRSSWDQVDQILGRNYTYNTYTYLWWPMEQYRNINWNALFGDPLLPEGVERHGLLNTSVRQALWDVFFYRDFNKYGQTFGGTFTDSTWPLRDELRLYIRKDTLVNLWDYGIDGISAAGLEIPYEAGEIILEPALVINETGFASGEETGFYAPRNVAVTADGRIYILDSGNQRVQVYSPDGVLLNSFGGPGNGPGQMAPGEFGQELQGPWGIAVSEEFVFVADTWNHRILKFSLEGQFLAAFGQNGDIGSDPLGGGLGIFFGPRGLVNVGNELLAITDTGHHRIQIMDFNGNFLGQVGNNGEFGAALGQFYEPVGIAAGPDGSVYVTDTWNGRMQQLTGDLFPLRDWDMETNWAGNFSLNNKPYVAVDSGGRVFVTDPEDSRVLIFNADGSYLARFGTFGTDTRSLNLPTGIFIDTQDNIYIADAGNNRVIKYNAIYPPAVPLEPVPEEPVEEEPVEEEPVEAPAEEEMEEAVDPSPTP
jgi:DNA-binding beta-propeller fold protein YncE